MHAAQNLILHSLLGRPNDPTFHVCPYCILHRQAPIKKVLAAKRGRFGGKRLWSGIWRMRTKDFFDRPIKPKYARYLLASLRGQ